MTHKTNPIAIARRLRESALCLFLAALAAPSFAESNLTVGWNDCVQAALSQNPDLSSSQAALKAGKYSFYGSFNGLLPQVSLTNSYNDSSSHIAANRWQAGMNANMNLFSMSQIASIETAHAAVSLAEAALRQTSATLRANLRNAFTSLIFAQENVEVSRNVLAIRQHSAQMLVLRYNAGQESKGNMMRSKAEALQAETGLAQSLRDLRASQKTLARQLGWDHFPLVAAKGTLGTNDPPQNPPENFEPLLSQRPDVALQEASVQSAKAAVSQSWSSVWPSLSANYSRSILDHSEFPNNNYQWTAMGLLSYPLFGGGPTATYFAVSSARKNLEKARQDLRSIRNSAVSDLESSYANFLNALDQVRVQTALLEAARQRNDEADVRYASGLLTYDNWEIIASDRINQEHQAIQARLNAAQAEAAWNKSMGIGL